MSWIPARCVLITAVASLSQFASAEVTFDLVTITDPGNAAYTTTPETKYVNGRGSVGYEYQIGRFEITTEQYLPFVNLFQGQIPNLRPNYWGAIQQFDGSYALHPGKTYAPMLPCEGISWEEAAMYVNWLHNGQRSDLASTQSGVYDTSTFTFNDGRQSYNHVLEPAPGARYWIPSLDEWLKAAHYDPDRHGPGQGGWWEYVNSSDVAPVPGWPGEGDTMSYITDFWPSELYDVPLGAYPHVQSPWGLLDLSGGTQEWTSDDYRGWRFNIVQGGSHAGWGYPENPDYIEQLGGASFPTSHTGGFRIASSVIPAPSALVVLVCTGFVFTQVRGSRHEESKNVNQ